MGFALASSRPHLEPFGIDRLSAHAAYPICAVRHPLERSVYLTQVVPDLVGHGTKLGALKSDRLPLWIVFIVGIRVTRGFDEPVHIPDQQDQTGTKVGALRFKPREGLW